MDTIQKKFQLQLLFKIKKIVDSDDGGNNFIINRTQKNIEFIREYGLQNEDIKNIVRQLSIDDCFSGPEKDRNPKFSGMLIKFNPLFENVKLYVKIRIENDEKAVCISIHEFGKYDEVE